MKAVILYRPNSEHASKVETFVHDFNYQQPGHEVELVSLDSVEGAEMAKLHDIMEYPAVLALGPEGQPLRTWQGAQMPLISELAYYAQS